jgi:hypothetical protein
MHVVSQCPQYTAAIALAIIQYVSLKNTAPAPFSQQCTPCVVNESTALVLGVRRERQRLGHLLRDDLQPDRDDEPCANLIYKL